jgi:putative (di)nucleoside polyphosphate hydrolase
MSMLLEFFAGEEYLACRVKTTLSLQCYIIFIKDGVVIDHQGFRLNVGIILMNAKGQLFWGKRIGQEHAWQFPQGGLQNYETVNEAMYRELTEEVGLQPQDVELIAITKQWLYYRLPRHFLRDTKPLCIGQKQKWFLLRLVSDESHIRLDHSGSPEFDGWRWVDYWEPLRDVISFKREVYKKALEEFEPLVHSAKIRH